MALRIFEIYHDGEEVFELSTRINIPLVAIQLVAIQPFGTEIFQLGSTPPSTDVLSLGIRRIPSCGIVRSCNLASPQTEEISALNIPYTFLNRYTYMRALFAIILISGFLICLTYPQDKIENQKSSVFTSEVASDVIVESENTMTGRFPVPVGFVRQEYPLESFERYLLELPLKDYNALVKYYDGSEKDNENIYCGVIEMDIDAVDLQQCADATMRLRGEYLYGQKRFNEIKFNFLSDGKPRYFKDYAKGDYSYKKFRKYMRYIFSYANTKSLENELQQVSDKSDIRAGDIFVVSGSPYGHAVIVMDVVHSKSSNEKRFILAQSYMPAQETQILLNTEAIKSPWLSTHSEAVETPQWNFNWEHLRRFGNDRS